MKTRYTFNSLVLYITTKLDSLKVKWRIWSGRLLNKSDTEIAKNVLGSKEEIEVLGRQITIVNALDRMGDVFDLSIKDEKKSYNYAFAGWTAILRYYPDRDEAHRWMAMFNTAQTFKDLWEFFLRENTISPQLVQFKPGYDAHFFNWFLTLELSPNYGFGINLDRAVKHASVPSQLIHEYNEYIRNHL